METQDGGTVSSREKVLAAAAAMMAENPAANLSVWSTPPGRSKECIPLCGWGGPITPRWSGGFEHP
jgi:hypothetical protein